MKPRRGVSRRVGPANAQPVAGGVGRWIRPALLAAAVTVAYANSLSGPFVLDDQASIVQNPDIRNLTALGSVLLPSPDSPVAGRPLANLSFALSYAIGGLDVTGYHVVNIAWHLACALLVFGLIRRVLGLPRMSRPMAVGPDDLAFAVALIWAVHPLNTEVVDYLTQRTESMAAAFLLLTLLASLRAATARSGARWTMLTVTACALGMATKESTAIAPVLVALFDRVFLFGSWREAFRARRGLYAGLASTWIVAAVALASGARSAVAGFSAGVPPWTYLLNQAVVIVDYVRLSVWPRNLVAFYGWPLELTFRDVAPQFIVLVVVGAATVVAIVRLPAREAGGAGANWLAYLGAWFFITLAPASSVVPVATEVGAERRMYLPLLALVTLVVAVAVWAWGRKRQGNLVPAVALVVLTAALTWVTMLRNQEYSSALTLAGTVVERRPTSVAHHILGEQLLLAGRVEEGIRELQTAVAKGNSRAGYQLGAALLNAGRADEAVQQFSAFVATAHPPRPLIPRWLEPTVVEVVTSRGYLAQIFGSRSEWDRMAEQATEMLRAVPGHRGGRRLLADARFGQERWIEAAGEYRAYLATQGGDASAWLNLGIASVATERIDDAVDAFSRAAAIEPGNERAQRLLAMAREDRARVAAAR